MVASLTALMLTACVSASEVVPIGNGRYMITGRASGGLNPRKKQSKQMVLQNLDKTGNAAVFGENINLTFSCE